MNRRQLADRAIELVGGTRGYSKSHDPEGFFRLVTEGRQITWTDASGKKRSYSACQDLVSRLALEACDMKQGMAWCNRVDGGNRWIIGQNLIRIKKHAPYAWKNYRPATEWDIKLGDAVEINGRYGPHVFVVTEIAYAATGAPHMIDHADYGQFHDADGPGPAPADHSCRLHLATAVQRDSKKRWCVAKGTALYPIIGRLSIADIADRELNTPPDHDFTPLRAGMVGVAVKQWQERLMELGLDLPSGADGIFGVKETAPATKELQQRWGLPVTGVVDQETWVAAFTGVG